MRLSWVFIIFSTIKSPLRGFNNLSIDVNIAQKEW